MSSSRLLPQEAPVMIAEKRKLFFSFFVMDEHTAIKSTKQRFAFWKHQTCIGLIVYLFHLHFSFAEIDLFSVFLFSE